MKISTTKHFINTKPRFKLKIRILLTKANQNGIKVFKHRTVTQPRKRIKVSITISKYFNSRE